VADHPTENSAPHVWLPSQFAVDMFVHEEIKLADSVRVDRARSLRSTFDSIRQVENEPIRASVQRFVGDIIY
jgi:hypothetical protein